MENRLTRSRKLALSKVKLRKSIRGEVRFDAGSRALYATDASNYRQIPIGLVIPRDADDVIATVAAAENSGRRSCRAGAGTSLAGQCCNVAVVLDFSKYMNKILDLDPAQRSARVQPGVVLDVLRNQAEKHRLTFAPDPATHSRCTLGGMMGNNSCGTHSLMGGKTVDNVEELDILLYDGTRMKVGRTSESDLQVDSRPRAAVAPRFTGASGRFATPTPRWCANDILEFPGESPATTLMSFCPKMDSMWRARWLGPKAPALRFSPPG